MEFFDSMRQQPLYILCLYLLIINIAAFFAMGADKHKAVHQKWRIPEKTLFILAALGGSVGGICGIYVFRHKTLHKKFTVGFPLILAVQLALAAVVYIKWFSL